MFARTSIWTGSDSELDRWAAHVADTVRPMVEGLAGNAGAVFLVDRNSKRALTLTLWDTEEAAFSSDQAAERNRKSTIAATGVKLLERGRYEVAAKV